MMHYSLLVIAFCALVHKAVLATFTIPGYELLGGLNNGICRGTGWSATNAGYLTPQQCADACDANPSCTAFDLARPSGSGTYDCYLFWTLEANLVAVNAPPNNFGCYKKMELTLTANFKMQCDDQAVISRSDDGGSTFSQVGTIAGWSNLYQTTFTSVTQMTVIRVVCTDTGAVVAGFIGQIEVNGELFLTTNPIFDGNWRRTALSITSDQSYVYTKWGTSARWNGGESPLISSDAYWIWNQQAAGWQQFDFNFGDIWCELSGLNLLSKAHRCTCQATCTGGYCNTLQFAADRLGDNIRSTSICSTGQCCCSCPNCNPVYTV